MRRLIAILAILNLSSFSIAAPLDTTGDAVVGQPGFSTNDFNHPDGNASSSNLSLSNAAGLAVGPNGRLYVADSDNNRVLSWASAAAFSNGAAADMVFGQPDFLSGDPNHGGVSAGSLNLPQGVWVDDANNLWVTDAFNSRVLKFNNPASDATPTLADLVVGQPDFVSADQNHGNGEHGTHVALADSLQFPGRVFVRGGDLWIADSGNSRVLHYPLPTANEPTADRVFGQYGDFTCRAKNNDGFGNNGSSASADNLYNPIGMVVDSAGRLYLADYLNNRIVRFDNPLTSDTTADAVYGQPNFTSSTPNNGGLAVGLQIPIDLAMDAAGRLIAADASNNRVVVYNSPLTSGAPNVVFGQLGSFLTNSPNHGLGTAATDANGLFGPTGVAVDRRHNVYISDTNNMRALRYDAPFGLPGDMNCDGLINVGDVEPWVLAVLNPSGYAASFPACDMTLGDLNGDGRIDGADVRGLVSAILGPP
ncbi:MAG TPA: hypothetical protein VMV81_06320 [Phycisphaerae bacterium]|nr:hypothetical protein [Phycisphaerae bacterium]